MYPFLCIDYLKIVSKAIDTRVYLFCRFRTCSGADRHRRGHQAADAAGSGVPFAWRCHAGVAEVQGQEAQLRPAGTSRFLVQKMDGWDVVK